MHAARPSLAFAALLFLCLACAPAPPRPPVRVASAPPSADLDYDSLLLAAQSYVDSGRANDAASVANDAARLDPKRPEAFIVWGRALAQADQLEASAARYEEARHLGSRDPALFAELASTYDVSKKYAEAVAVYRDFLTDHPKDAGMRDELAVTLLLLDRPDEAVEVLEPAVQAQPDSAQLRQDVGYAYLRANRPQDALLPLQWVVKHDPQRLEATRYLAQALAATGSTEQARQLLDQLLGRAPRDRGARSTRARLRLVDGFSQDALDDYRVLLAETPQDGAALLGLAAACVALERLDDAQQAVTNARAALGDLPQVRFRQAQIDWRRGKLDAILLLERLAGDSGNAQEAWQEVAKAAARTHNRELAQRAAKHLPR